MKFHGVNKNCERLCYHCYYTDKNRGATNICNLRYKKPKEKPVVFHNDYQFIIKQLAEVFEGQFKYLGENAEKYIKFSVPIENKEKQRTITHRIRFIDNARFMASCL